MRSELHDLVGPYALNALDDTERARFEAHLDDCATCRAELAGLVQATAALAPSVPTSDALRERVLAAARTTPQLKPVQPRLTRGRLLLAVGAAAAAVAVGFGIVANQEPDVITAADVFAASDSNVQTIETPHGEVRVATSDDLHRAALDLSELQDAPDGQTYQTWLVVGETPKSVAVGADSVLTPLQDGAMAVTVEPDGGSPAPTTEPFVAVTMEG